MAFPLSNYIEVLRMQQKFTETGVDRSAPIYGSPVSSSLNLRERDYGFKDFLL